MICKGTFLRWESWIFIIKVWCKACMILDYALGAPGCHRWLMFALGTQDFIIRSLSAPCNFFLALCWDILKLLVAWSCILMSSRENVSAFYFMSFSFLVFFFSLPSSHSSSSFLYSFLSFFLFFFIFSFLSFFHFDWLTV